jgi:putative membrane protein
MSALFAAFGFPELNATLNALCLVLLVCGYAAIRRGRRQLHIKCMVSALVVSAAFLASYLYYHYTKGHVSFGEQYMDRHGESPAGWLYAAYGVILLTHTLLAVAVAPLALVTATLGWYNALTWHRRIAYWTLPIWLYVSVTGIVVYALVYQL